MPKAIFCQRWPEVGNPHLIFMQKSNTSNKHYTLLKRQFTINSLMLKLNNTIKRYFLFDTPHTLNHFKIDQIVITRFLSLHN